MSALGTVNNIRKMKRALQLREETDPLKVGELLERILKEAIALRSSSDGFLGKGAVRELSNIRRALIAGQIESGNNIYYINKYSNVLDGLKNIEDEEKETKKKKPSAAKEAVAGGLGGLRNSLPGVDTITSALMTANPVIGYGIRAAQQIGQTSKRIKETKTKEQKERQEKLESLAEGGGLPGEDDKLEPTSTTGTSSIGNDDYTGSLLKNIDSNITKIKDSLIDQKDVLADIHDTNKDNLNLEKRQYEEKKSDKLESDFENAGNGAGSLAGVNEEGKKGFFGGLLDSLGSGTTFLLAPFMKLISFLKIGGSILMKVGKFAGVVAIVKGIYDFFDGLFKAEEIIGKDDINWKERIGAAISNVIAGLLAPIDWIAEQFGMDLFDEKNLASKVYEVGKKMLDKAIAFTTDMIEFVVDGFKGMLNKGSDIFNNTIKKVEDSINTVINFFGNMFTNMKEGIKTFISDNIGWLPDIIENKIRKKLGLPTESSVTDAHSDVEAVDTAQKISAKREEVFIKEIMDSPIPESKKKAILGKDYIKPNIMGLDASRGSFDGRTGPSVMEQFAESEEQADRRNLSGDTNINAPTIDNRTSNNTNVQGNGGSTSHSSRNYDPDYRRAQEKGAGYAINFGL